MTEHPSARNQKSRTKGHPACAKMDSYPNPLDLQGDRGSHSCSVRLKMVDESKDQENWKLILIKSQEVRNYSQKRSLRPHQKSQEWRVTREAKFIWVNRPGNIYKFHTKLTKLHRRHIKMKVLVTPDVEKHTHTHMHTWFLSPFSENFALFQITGAWY